jgi:hypothetical protein
MFSRIKKLVLVVILALFAVVSMPAFGQESPVYYGQRDLPRKQPEKAKEKEKEKPKPEGDRGSGRDRGDSKRKDDKKKPEF